MIAHSLDIVLPCYNPHVNWTDEVIFSFREICKALPSTQINLILVNDGSTRNVTENNIVALKKAIPFLTYIDYNENCGKGYALRKGIVASKAEICIYTDIDFPYSTSSIISIWDALKGFEFDIVAGIKNEHYYEQVPLIRKFISKCLRLFSGTFLRLKIKDTQCGLKGMNEKGKAVFLATTIHRYLFDLEFIFLASRNKVLKINSKKIQLKENIQFSKMNFKIVFTESINFMKILLKRIF